MPRLQGKGDGLVTFPIKRQDSPRGCLHRGVAQVGRALGLGPRDAGSKPATATGRSLSMETWSIMVPRRASPRTPGHSHQSHRIQVRSPLGRDARGFRVPPVALVPGCAAATEPLTLASAVESHPHLNGEMGDFPFCGTITRDEIILE